MTDFDATYSLFSPQDIVINLFLLDHKEMQDLDPADRRRSGKGMSGGRR